jgi:hypothetical protein
MDQQLMLTANEIAKAVEAVRALTDIVEKMHKATWPDVDRGDVLRKADLDLPRASDAGDAASRALALLEDAKRRVERIEAARDLEAQYERRRAEREVSR